MATFDIEEHLNHHDGFELRLAFVFVQFLKALFITGLKTIFHNHQIPSGNRSMPIGILAHCSPLTPESLPYSTFDYSWFSIKLLTALFPDSRDQYFWHDLFCKGTEMRWPNGEKKTNEETYESKDLLKEHEASTKRLTEISAAIIWFVFGEPDREFFEETFNIPATSAGIDKYRIVKHTVVGREVCNLTRSSKYNANCLVSATSSSFRTHNSFRSGRDELSLIALLLSFFNCRTSWPMGHSVWISRSILLDFKGKAMLLRRIPLHRAKASSKVAEGEFRTKRIEVLDLCSESD